MATENGGPLFIGSSRTRLVKRWIPGSTSDQAIERVDVPGVRVIVYAKSTGITDCMNEAMTPLGRIIRRFFGRIAGRVRLTWLGLVDMMTISEYIYSERSDSGIQRSRLRRSLLLGR